MKSIVHIFEMPLDYGASRHGSYMGPAAIKLAGLEATLADLGITPQFLRRTTTENRDVYLTTDPGDLRVKYLEPVVEACTALASGVEESVTAGAFPLVLGGDHSIALGTLAGIAAGCRKKNLIPGVLYVDAHGDFNTPETSPSGNIHGMCMAASCGVGIPQLTNLYFDGQKIDPHNVFYFGVRDIDPGEKKLMKDAGVSVITMSDIDRRGFSACIQQIITFFKERTNCVHLSFDIDVMDPDFAPGVGIEVPGGLTYREALLMMDELYTADIITSMELVEVNPVLDIRNKTAKMAVEIIARLFGSGIF